MAFRNVALAMTDPGRSRSNSRLWRCRGKEWGGLRDTPLSRGGRSALLEFRPVSRSARTDDRSRALAAVAAWVIPAIWQSGQHLRTKNHRASFREAFRAPIRVSIGKPMHVSEADDPVEGTAALRSELETLLADAQATYPRSGEGQWWQPPHLGGSAPTPEVAAEMEAERQRKRSAEKQ